MVDFNQALGFGDVIRRCDKLDEQGLYWFEEPIAYDNVRGYAQLAHQVHTPLQMGENLLRLARPVHIPSPPAPLPLRHGRPDADRRRHRLAASGQPGRATRGSITLYPEICAHLMRVTPTAHWLEWVDWAQPDPGGADAAGGRASDGVGPTRHGIAWDETAVSKYAVAT